MRTRKLIVTSVATTLHNPPAWVKLAARAGFLIVSVAGAMWAGDSWLSLRGFGGL